MPELSERVQTAAVTKAAVSGACESCDWSRTGAGASAWLSARAAARRHVATTGHVAFVITATRYVYRIALATSLAEPLDHRIALVDGELVCQDCGARGGRP